VPLEPPAFIIEQAAPAPDLPSLIFSRHFVGQGDLVDILILLVSRMR